LGWVLIGEAAEELSVGVELGGVVLAVGFKEALAGGFSEQLARGELGGFVVDDPPALGGGCGV
jgi:hypothetical protein